MRKWKTRCKKGTRPKEELAIEVADVDSVHVDYMNISEPTESQVGQDLAAQTAGADDENLGLVAKKLFDLAVGESVGGDTCSGCA